MPQLRHICLLLARRGREWNARDWREADMFSRRGGQEGKPYQLRSARRKVGETPPILAPLCRLQVPRKPGKAQNCALSASYFLFSFNGLDCVAEREEFELTYYEPENEVFLPRRQHQPYCRP